MHKQITFTSVDIPSISVSFDWNEEVIFGPLGPFLFSLNNKQDMRTIHEILTNYPFLIKNYESNVDGLIAEINNNDYRISIQ